MNVKNTQKFKYCHGVAVFWCIINYLHCLFLNGEDVVDMSLIYDTPDGAAVCRMVKLQSCI